MNPDTQLSPRARRLALAVVITAVTLDSALIELIAPLLPEIERRTGAGADEIGVALAAYSIPIVLLSIPIGLLADRLGRRRFLIGGLLMTSAGSLLIAGSESLQLLIIGRAVQGLGSVASWVAALTVVSDLAPPGKRGEAIGYAFAAVGAGSLGGPALGGITADSISFEAPFLIVAVLAASLATAALFVRIPTGTGGRASGRPGARLFSALRSRTGALGAGIALVAAGITGLLEIVAPLDLDARLGLSATVIGLLFSGAIAVDAVIAPIGGRFGDRHGRERPALAGLVLLAASLAWLATQPGIFVTALALALFGAGISLAFAAAVPWLDESFEESDRTLAYGALNLVYAGGYVVGPAAGGLLFEHAGASFAYLAGAGLIAALCIPLLWGRRPATSS